MIRQIILCSAVTLSAGFFNAQDVKAPNLLPAGVSVSAVAKPAFLAEFPTTSWKDFADTSWYNAADTNFQISSAQELAGLSKLVAAGNTFSGKNIKLMQDVDLQQHLWDPIGYNNKNPFSGNFDGNNKTIRNLQINRVNGDWLGLFGQFATATVKDLTLDGSRIYGSDTSGGFIGNITTNSKVENCHVRNVELVLTGYNGGGFTGGVLTDSEIINCSASGSVIGVNQIGGFAGTSWNNSLISKSYSEGTVEGQYFIGGFSGFVTFAFGPTVNRIEDSYSRSDVTGSVEAIGGFYGAAQNTGNFKNVYSTGTVSLTADAGGFIGVVGNLAVQNAHFDSTRAPFEPVGAFMGAPATLDITGHPTAEMQTAAFAATMNAGATGGVWSYDAAINDGYPHLNTQTYLATGEVKSAADLVKITPTLAETSIRIITAEKSVSYEITDFSGKSVRRGTTGAGQEVNVASLAKGVYIITVRTAGGTSNLKFIKK